ncbi:hypothetical protein [Pectinatus brassicae]|uniref:Uncharacterized protein n=1 Tax=Pectinatus brassicae TaxID=862415 RepID=A0A840UT28_9FIRM|nr:hypothetical protein [Pectinatus brassicae]MBB5336113.1 hypothetical protein [Pectinatus brassicae]
MISTFFNYIKILQNTITRIRNDQVVGSIPIASSSEIKASEVIGGFFVVYF